ncbi:hypothetical protein ILYODFUR_035533 [Ilyodon furcidens]|uniref:Uncharacterized protein n=1 Tax=Ilyodon furcidens TaxID=33524 RepID=A0ABV0VJZ2_9TELE
MSTSSSSIHGLDVKNLYSTPHQHLFFSSYSSLQRSYLYSVCGTNRTPCHVMSGSLHICFQNPLFSRAQISRFSTIFILEIYRVQNTNLETSSIVVRFQNL